MNNLEENKQEYPTESKTFFRLDKFSLGFFGAIILLLIMTITLSVQDTDMTNKDKAFIPKLIKKIEVISEKEEEKNIKEINLYIKNEVHQIFRSVYIKIPTYVDTQYTWYKDYISMYMSAKVKAKEWWKIWDHFVLTEIYNEDIPPPKFETKSYAQKSSDEIQQVLFSNGEFDKKLDQVYFGVNTKMQELFFNSQNTLLASVKVNEANLHDVNIQQVRELSTSIQDTFVAAKNNLSKVAQVKQAGTVGLSLIFTKTITAKILAKSGVKIIAKSGGFWAGATTGLTVCAPSGPWALACGAVVGTVTWIGVDFAVSKADEIITKQAFERKLTQSIQEMEENYTIGMQQAFKQGINKTYIQLDEKMHLRPIDTFE